MVSPLRFVDSPCISELSMSKEAEMYAYIDMYADSDVDFAILDEEQVESLRPDVIDYIDEKMF